MGARMSRSLLALLSATVAAVLASVLMSPAVFAATSIQVTEEQVFLLPASNNKSFEVVEELAVKNTAATAEQVVVSLPSGYQSLQVGGHTPAAGAVHAGTLTLPHAASAGKTSKVVVSYQLSLGGQHGLQFTLHANYPVYVAHLYLPEGNVALSAQDVFTTTSTTNIQGTTFRVFTREGIPAGDDWTLSLQLLPGVTKNTVVQGLPVLGAPENGLTNELQAIGNLVVIAFVLAIGILGIRRTGWNQRRMALAKEDVLYRAWEQIEMAHMEGTLGDEAYEQRRTQVKQRLVDLKSKSTKAEVDSEDARL